MATRSQNVLSLSHLSGLLLAVLVILLNAFFARADVRVDLTEDGLWTLSPGTRDVLRGLQDPASIKVFWKDVPQSGESEADRRYLTSLLEEMRSAADGKLVVRWVDLETKDGEQEADALNVQVYQVQDVVKGEVRLANSFQTLVIEHGSREPARLEPLINRRTEYEYEIATKLFEMSRASVPVVGIISSKPQANPFMQMGAQGGRFGALEQALQQELGYNAVKAYLTLDEPVPEEVKVLVLAAPKDLEAKQVWNLEQFALRGGKTILLLDPVTEEIVQGHTFTPDSSGLDEWLAHLGVTVEKSVAGDYASPNGRPRIVQTRQGRMLEFVEDAFWPKILGKFMDQSVPATRGFSELPLYWPAPLSFDAEKAKATSRKVTVLATTSPYGGRETEIANLSRGGEEPRDTSALSKIPVMLLVEGPLDSFWKGKPSPEEEAKKKEEEAKKKEEEEKKKAEEEKKAAEAKEGEKPAEAPKDGEKKEDEKKDDEEKDGEPEKKDEAEKKDEPKGPARLDQGNVFVLVVGDAEMVADQPAAFLEQRIRPFGRSLGYGRGFAFLRNVLDWASGSEALLALRARQEKPRLLEKVEPESQKVLSLLNTLGVPLLVFFAGVVVFLVRRFQK